MQQPAWRTVTLLAGAFRQAVDELHRELADQGHPDARPMHGFALQAVGPEGCTIMELGRRLGVSKQAAAKTAVGLEKSGYLTREAVPGDRRAVHLRRTDSAEDLLARSEAGFERVVQRWRAELGDSEFDAFAQGLSRVAGSGAPGAGSFGAGSFGALADLPGWLTR